MIDEIMSDILDAMEVRNYRLCSTLARQVLDLIESGEAVNSKLDKDELVFRLNKIVKRASIEYNNEMEKATLIEEIVNFKDEE